MTGPGHYTEAERLITYSRGDVTMETSAAALAEAQVHATLALAAATGLSNASATTEDNLAWLDAASEWKRPA